MRNRTFFPCDVKSAGGAPSAPRNLVSRVVRRRPPLQPDVACVPASQGLRREHFPRATCAYVVLRAPFLRALPPQRASRRVGASLAVLARRLPFPCVARRSRASHAVAPAAYRGDHSGDTASVRRHRVETPHGSNSCDVWIEAGALSPEAFLLQFQPLGPYSNPTWTLIEPHLDPT